MILAKPEKAALILRAVYGDHWQNALNLAKAEALYLRDERFDSLLQVVGTIPMLRNDTAGTALLFPALFLQVTILVMNGQTESIVLTVVALHSQLHINGKEEFLPNLDAMEAHAALYDSDYARVADWMRNEAPDEIRDFCTLDTYRYMVKLRQTRHGAGFAFTDCGRHAYPGRFS